MKKPYGVIFDLGDTVLRLDSTDWIAACKELLGYVENETDLTPEALQEIAFGINDDFERQKIDSKIEMNVVHFYRALFETAGLSLSISYDEAARICWNSAFTFTPEEGINDVLDILQKYKIPTGILSNGSFPGVLLEEELAKHNLLHRFSFVMSSADYSMRKPHPRFFNIAAKKLDIKPQDIWFVGDNPQIDIKGAITVGMYPVWYNPRDGRLDPQYDCLEINHWNKFNEIINSLH
ncbi:MAG: HAD family hydrolase [Dehalococcoidales bacterium]|nr:MAG: HAD family hydrolase [Dehalococcoidales bacterium]